MVFECPECGAENEPGAQYCSLCLSRLGFESPEIPTVEAHGKGLEPQPQETSVSGPVEVVPPDYRSPADWSGPLAQKTEGTARATRAAAFSWDKGVVLCIYGSIAAGVLTLVLEFIIGIFAEGEIVSGSVEVNYTWIFFTLIVPVCVVAVFIGYRAGRYGWLLGMITVVTWAIVTKPLFNYFFLWIMDASHTISPFVWERIALDLAVALPFGALFGWIGQKWATARTTALSRKTENQ